MCNLCRAEALFEISAAISAEKISADEIGFLSPVKKKGCICLRSRYCNGTSSTAGLPQPNYSVPSIEKSACWAS